MSIVVGVRSAFYVLLWTTESGRMSLRRGEQQQQQQQQAAVICYWGNRLLGRDCAVLGQGAGAVGINAGSAVERRNAAVKWG